MPLGDLDDAAQRVELDRLRERARHGEDVSAALSQFAADGLSEHELGILASAPYMPVGVQGGIRAASSKEMEAMPEEMRSAIVAARVADRRYRFRLALAECFVHRGGAPAPQSARPSAGLAVPRPRAGRSRRTRRATRAGPNDDDSDLAARRPIALLERR
jgi:hypothetical protein